MGTVFVKYASLCSRPRYYKARNLMTVSANECLVSRPAPRKRITVAIRSSAPGAKVRGGGKGGKGAGKQVSCLHVDYTNAQQWRAAGSQKSWVTQTQKGGGRKSRRR